MKVLVLGGSGMLGHKLVQVLQPELEVWTTVKRTFNEYEKYGIFDEARTITGADAGNFQSVEFAIRQVRPDVVINAIGIIKQLPNAKNVIQTLTTNAIFPHHLAELAKTLRFRFITISTDCVFDGRKGNYNENDAPNALDLYGTSKRLGEIVDSNCLTLRTSIIGRELATSHSLLEWFLSNRGGKVNGFVNAIYSGFPTVVLSEIVKEIILNHPHIEGLFNVSSDAINKYELLKMIKTEFGLDIEIQPSEEFKIDRSLDSSAFRNLTSFNPPAWDQMVKQMASDNTPYDQWRAPLLNS
jgi:dTDP-4-dehydrorhamnose reductase